MEKDDGILFRIFNGICDVWKFGRSSKRTNEQDWSSAYIVIDDGSANPKQLYNANKSVTISTVKNISYDKKTNTLTLNGYQEAEKRIVANEMGDDFKVKVVGNNQYRELLYGVTLMAEALH